MKIGHRAFLDLEQALAKPLTVAWRSYFAEVVVDLKRAINVRNWTEAGDIVNDIDTEHLVTDHAQLAATMATASYLLGVSRVAEIEGHKPDADTIRRIQNGVTQWGRMLSRNLPQKLRLRLHRRLAKIEHGLAMARHVFAKAETEAELETEDPGVWVEVEDLMEEATTFGVSMTALSASLLTSRLSNYGALSQMYSAGTEKYMISAILDKDTCDVCEALDGSIFQTDDGVRQATA